MKKLWEVKSKTFPDRLFIVIAKDIKEAQKIVWHTYGFFKDLEFQCIPMSQARVLFNFIKSWVAKIKEILCV